MKYTVAGKLNPKIFLVSFTRTRSSSRNFNSNFIKVACTVIVTAVAPQRHIVNMHDRLKGYFYENSMILHACISNNFSSVKNGGLI